MKNLKEIVEKYKDQERGLGYIGWGGKDYYEINSDEPLSLNNDSKGFILNDKGEVELYKFVEAPYQYYYKGKEITEADYDRLEQDPLEEDYLDIRREDVVKWLGKTLDNYYPYPWYPEKKIIGFKIMKNIPLFEEGEICKTINYIISSKCYGVMYTQKECLEMPEFFKPIYE